MKRLIGALLATSVAASVAISMGATVAQALTPAPPVLVSPTPAAVVPEGPVAFAGEDQPDAYAAFLLVSERPVLTPDGRLADPWFYEASIDADGRTTFTDPDIWWDAGIYYWQLMRIDCRHSRERYCAIVSDISHFRVGDGPPPIANDFEAIDADLEGAPIPPALGPRRKPVRFTLSTARLPTSVGVDRLAALVDITSWRWGVRIARETDRPVVSGDRTNTIGFSPHVRRGTLGVLRTSVRTYRFGRRVIRREIVEQDLILSRNLAWNAGPDYPSARTYDLQTVLLHELGHAAGNEHVGLCRNSPMVATLGRGGYWYSRNDYWFPRCGRGAQARATAAGTPVQPMRFDHRTIEVETVRLDKA